jgi:hypothetical protein
MNVSDPLWNSPAGNSTSSSNATTYPSAATSTTQLEKAQLVLRQALSTTSSEIVASLTATSIGALTTPGGNGFSQSQTDQIIAAISNSGGGGHLWTFKSFWYIAVIVTALTIMFPLVAGGILRAIYRFSHNHKNYWHIAVFLSVLGVLIVLDYFMPTPIFLGIFGAPQAILALWQLYQVEKSGKNKRRWAGYTTLLAICVGVDLVPEGATVVTNFIHFGQSIGLTGFLPPLYLFIMWIQPGNSFLTKNNFLTLVDNITPEVATKWDSNKLGLVMLLGAGEGINSMLGILLPGNIYILGLSVPLGMHGLDRLIFMSRNKRSFDVGIWVAFLCVLASSIVLYVYTSVYYVGPVGLFPCLYLYIFRRLGWA